MPYHPLPDTPLTPLDGVRFELRHTNSFVRLDDPEIDESHIHNCYELYINVSGNVSFLVENRLYPIQSGDVVITRPGEMHLCIYNSSCVHDHFCLWIEVPDGSSLLSFFSDSGFCNLYTPDPDNRQLLFDLLYLLEKLVKQNRQLAQTSSFLQLLTLFECQSKPESTPQAMVPEELQQILDYINRHFREIQHIKEIYDLFFISPSTMNRLFRRYIHLSPREFLETKKLSCAQQLLMSGLTVTQVCLQCGFSDCSHFIAIFKKKFGETPYQYKMNRNTKFE